jgi:hypothetical protein
MLCNKYGLKKFKITSIHDFHIVYPQFWFVSNRRMILFVSGNVMNGWPKNKIPISMVENQIVIDDCRQSDSISQN